MSYEPHGNHVIAGTTVQGEKHFESDPATGPAASFSVGRVSDVEKAVAAAEHAFISYGYSTRQARADFLNSIADEIDARGDAITDIGTRETGLPEARLQGERGRTCGQLRLFAEHISGDAYLDKRHQNALPDRKPIPGPEHKLIQRPIGPVAVFGASNFPLAFSTAGGDTAAALSGRCERTLSAPRHQRNRGRCHCGGGEETQSGSRRVLSNSGRIQRCGYRFGPTPTD